MEIDYKQKLNNVLAAYKNLQEDNERLVELANTLEAKKEGEYWAWQNDEYDHLESLTCPILIPAETLRDLLDKAYTSGLIEGYKIKAKYNPGVK